MIPSSLSRRYAKALLALGIDNETFEQIGTQLQQVATLWQSHRDLRPTLENPSHPLERRRALLIKVAELLRVDVVVRNFLLLLLERQRIDILPAVARDYGAACDRHAGRVRAEVVSAHPLDSHSLQQLRDALEKRTGQQVLLTTAVDPDLLAGTVTKLGSIVYDGSLSTKLDQMRETMLGSRA